MKYYARKFGTTTFLGPFSWDDLERELAEGNLTPLDEAILYKGQTYAQLKRASGWTPISRVKDMPDQETAPQRANPAKLLGLAGLFIGGSLGYLFRPSNPFFGQLPFSAVITRGATLRDLDGLLIPWAEQSFNYLAVSALAGCICGWVIGTFLRSLSGSGVPVSVSRGNVVAQDATDQLKQLARLREEHLITQEEYEAKRSQILDRI